MTDLEKIAKNSKSDEEALVELHAHGASPIQSIKILVSERGLTLHDAKSKLMESPSWFAEADAANRLHEELDKLLEEDDL